MTWPKWVTPESHDACGGADFEVGKTSTRDARSVELDEFFAWWQRIHGFWDPRLDEVRRVLSVRHVRDRTRFSGVFEPSFSYDRRGWYFFRFSYSFPDFREDPCGCLRVMLDLARPFGTNMVRWFRRLLPLVFVPCVEHPLFGLAYDSTGSWRVKLYYQFKDSAKVEAIRLAGWLLGRGDLDRVGRGRPLHMVGLDLSPKGIRAVKLYYMHERIRILWFPYVIARLGLVDRLAGQGVRELKRVLEIHRLRSPDDPDFARIAEVDFSLVENNLRWKHLAVNDRDPGPAERPGRDSEAVQVPPGFVISVRRITISVAEVDKLNVYYLPLERASR